MTLGIVGKQAKDYTIDIKTVNNIKSLGLDMINTAKSGHPGIVLGAAPIIYRLYNNHLIFDNNNPNWINRDRFIMSAGHGSALLYATLFMSGFDLTINDLKEFRNYGSKTPGHPEVGVTPGVDCSTGPLGQGIATAVGMAIGEAYLNQKFKSLKASLIDHYTYVLCGDGDLMEGISSESASLAGSLGLGKIIVLYDSNGISLDGSTTNVFDENVLKKYRAMGWDTHLLKDPYDFEEFDNLIERAKKAVDRPSIIKIETVIGKDSKYQNTNTIHGKPLSKEDLKNIKKKLGIREIPYTVLSDAYNNMKKCIDERNDLAISKWEKTCEKVMQKLDKSIIEDYEKLLSHEDINIESTLDNKQYSGRELAHTLLNKIPKKETFCLLTDTSSSTQIFFDKEENFSKKNRLGKNLQCGVRELSASAIQNGLALMNIKTVSSTFLAFSNYMIPSIRMASLMNLNTTYIFTHDSVLIGEDGPTHQPIEQIDQLRLIPNLTVFRPCDANEMTEAFNYSFNSDKPCAIIVSKEVIPISKEHGYIIEEEQDFDICLIASGTEVELAIQVSKALEKHMIKSRVISIPSLELFDKETNEEKEKILPKDKIKVVLELSTCNSYYKYLSQDDLVFNIKEFMKSGNKYSIIHRLNYDVDSITKNIAFHVKQKISEH
ncbi:MAG: transketolase [Bacilli bacterium]|nr:transketolase [Bacilli bacterium]